VAVAETLVVVRCGDHFVPVMRVGGGVMAVDGRARGFGSGGALGMNSHALAVRVVALHADVRDLGLLDVTVVGRKEESQRTMSPTPVVCRSPSAGPTAFGVGCLLGGFITVTVTVKRANAVMFVNCSWRTEHGTLAHQRFRTC
jgi:hypothetical protein